MSRDLCHLRNALPSLVVYIYSGGSLSAKYAKKMMDFHTFTLREVLCLAGFRFVQSMALTAPATVEKVSGYTAGLSTSSSCPSAVGNAKVG